MKEIGTDFLYFSVQASIFMIGVSLILVLIRLVRGPDLPDRVIALDLFTFLLAGFIGVYTVDSYDASYLDVSITVTLIGFLATLGFARYIHRIAIRRKNHGTHS